MLLPRLLFENERVCVRDLRLPPRMSTHVELTYPTVRWQVEDGIHETADGSKEHVPNKHVFFDEAGVHCSLRNASPNSEYRQIWFEIKKEPRRSEEMTNEILSRSKYPTNVGTELLLENRWCRVWDFYLQPRKTSRLDTSSTSSRKFSK